MNHPLTHRFALVVSFALLWSAPSLANTVLLDADFESQSLGAIGTGGAALGEPADVEFQIDAQVFGADDPMPTQSLRFADISTQSAQAATFNFLNSEEVSTGRLSVEFEMYLPSPITSTTGFSVAIRELSTSAKAFADLSVTSTGIRLSDAGPEPLTFLADTPEGQVFLVELVFDFETLTYSVDIDGVRTVTDRYHSVADRGIGQVKFVADFDTNIGDLAFVDNILVTKTPPTPARTLLSVDLEGKGVDLPIGVGGATVNEPSSVDAGLDAVVRDVFAGTQQLEITDQTDSLGQVSFELLNQEELTAGLVRAHLNLWFQDEGTYRLLFLDSTSVPPLDSALFAVSFLHDSSRGSRSMEITDQSSETGGVAFSDPTGDRYVIDRGRGIRLAVEINLSTNHYSVVWDGEALVESRDYAQPTAGFARLVLSVDADPDNGDSLHLDGLLVEDITEIFSDGFESGSTTAW